MADNTILNAGSGGDTLRTEDVGGGVKIPVSKIHNGAADVDGGAITAANPFQVVIVSGSQGVSVVGTSLSTMPQSGSLTGLLVGGVALSNANPLPVTGSIVLARGAVMSSGSLTGLLVGGVAVSNANPVPISDGGGSITVDSAAQAGGQILSGSTIQVVHYSFLDAISGSANQVVPPQGVGNAVRLLGAHVMSPSNCTVRWISTGSVGSITNLSGLVVPSANGGYVLPESPHGWLQTKTNEGLNLQVNIAGGTVGVTITWMISGG